jgi:hypothetical protein
VQWGNWTALEKALQACAVFSQLRWNVWSGEGALSDLVEVDAAAKVESGRRANVLSIDDFAVHALPYFLLIQRDFAVASVDCLVRDRNPSRLIGFGESLRDISL